MVDMNKVFEAAAHENGDYYVEKEKFDVVPVKGFMYGLQIRDGEYLPHLVKNLSVIKNMKLRDDDVFVITFPKSGTNWLGEIVTLIQTMDFDMVNNQSMFKRAPILEFGFSSRYLDEMTSPRILKSHLQLKFLPDDLQHRVKIIYCIRNPKDVIVSFYHFAKSLKDDEFLGSIEDMHEAFCDGEIPFGSWWNHVDQYMSMDNVHILHYEDILENTFDEVKKLASYLGKSSLSNDDIERIISHCSFRNMKSSPAYDLKPIAEKGALFHSNINFFRKGQIGDWKNYFSEDMSKRVDDIVRDKLKHKIDFKYEPTKIE